MQKFVLVKIKTDKNGILGKEKTRSFSPEEKKGLFAQPSLQFSGMVFTFEVTVVIRGFKAAHEFGNEKEPFLKAEINNLPKFYIT